MSINSQLTSDELLLPLCSTSKRVERAAVQHGSLYLANRDLEEVWIRNPFSSMHMRGVRLEKMVSCNS
jgi:hypothetical protein